MGLMPMKLREVIRLLEKHGWVEMRSRGSHRHFKHPDQAVAITVPGNDGGVSRGVLCATSSEAV